MNGLFFVFVMAVAMGIMLSGYKDQEQGNPV